MRTISFIAAILIALPVVAKPLAEPAGARLKHPITFVTNALPMSKAYEHIVNGIEQVNSYLKEDMLFLNIQPVPPKYHMHPLLNSITVASRDVFVNILGIFSPNTLGMAIWSSDPLKHDDIMVSKVLLYDIYETEHMGLYVTIHELLHALGVPHTSSPDDLMYPKYSPKAKVTGATLAQLLIRYELNPEYEKKALDYLDMLNASKVPEHDAPAKKDPDGAFPNGMHHVCPRGGVHEKN